LVQNGDIVKLNDAQQQYLLSPIHRSRVGKDGKGFAHVEAWDIRRVLNGTFGFTGWSGDTVSMELIYDEVSGNRYSVAYRAQYRITVGDSTYTEWAVGDCKNYPSRGDAHDMAIKTAESQAFKRAAMNLGDQFGLSLYDGGSLKQSIKATLDAPVGTAQAADKAKEFADDLEIEGGVTLTTAVGRAETSDVTPVETVAEPADPAAEALVGRIREAMNEGDVEGIVALRQEASKDDMLEAVFEGKTIAKYVDLAMVFAGKVKAGREALGGEEIQA
jgi:hypothetical protein